MTEFDLDPFLSRSRSQAIHRSGAMPRLRELLPELEVGPKQGSARGVKPAKPKKHRRNRESK